MRKINYKSDFDFLMRLKDSAGKEVPFPECDWDAVFWTSSKAKAYHASCIGGVCTNCRKEANGTLFIFDSHAMGLGTLHWEPHFRLPNDIFPDGYQDLFRKAALGIELVDGDGDEATKTEIEYIIPYIKGDKGDAFTYDDFSVEEIADLKRPAVEAAESVTKTESEVKEAEALRVKAEDDRATAEQSRIISEQARAEAEKQRITSESARARAESERATAEESRDTAEKSREEAESARAGAEAKRATDFNAAQTQRANDYAMFKATADSNESGRVNAEKARVTAEDARSEAETARATAESNRVKNEQNRVTAESARVQEESDRVTAEQNRVSAESLRTTAEQGRVSAESSRVTAEQGRVTAEQSRVTAEQNRATEFAGFADTIAAKQDAITTSNDLSLSEENVLALTDMAKMRLFDDMWTQAVGSYGSIDHTHVEDGVSKPYYLNELWLTYKEAVEIFGLGKLTNTDLKSRYAGRSIRTVLPTNINVSTASASRVFSNSKIEKVHLGIFVPGNHCFENCDRLDTILRLYSPNTDMNINENKGIYQGCVKLKSIRSITRTYAMDFSLEDSPLIDHATMAQIVKMKLNADAAKSMTITVHPDVYAKLTDTTNTEWNAVLTAAAAKNISFATV